MTDIWCCRPYCEVCWWGRTFPPGLDLDSRVTVGRIVRNGSAVTDARLAPAVEHHARAVLAIPFQPILAGMVFGLGFLANLAATAFAFADGDTKRAVWHSVFLPVFVLAFTTVPRQARLRRRAEAAHQHAQRLLES